jgi:hypothetical protein
MKSQTIFLFATLLLIGGVATPSVAQDKRAQTVMKFLSVPVGARPTGMSDAVTSLDNGVDGIYSNPASIAFTKGNQVSFGNVQWIADIQYQYAGAVFAPANGLYGVFGVSFLGVDYGTLTETVANQNPDTGYDIIGTFSPKAFAYGLSYARAITTQFAVGANIRYVDQQLANAIVSRDATDFGRVNIAEQNYSIDFGVLFKTGFESLNLGMSVRNYGREVDYVLDSQEMPLTFRMGLSMNVFDLTSLDPNTHSLLVSVDANRPRDYYEQILIGTEYTFMKRLALRGGYAFPSDEQGFSAGVGVIQPFGRRYGVRADYSYTSFGVFNGVNRLGIQLTF